MKHIYTTILFIAVFLVGADGINAQYRSYRTNRDRAVEQGRQETSTSRTSTTDTRSSRTGNTPTRTSGTSSSTRTSGRTEERPFGFELTFNNFDVLASLQSQIAAQAAAKKEIDEWLKKQEGTFLKEINRQMGTNHTSFSTAQREYFKYYENQSGKYGPVATTERLESDKRSKAKSHAEKRDAHAMDIYLLDEWKRCHCSELGNLKVGGYTLNSLDSDTGGGPFLANALRLNARDGFGKEHYQNGLNDVWAKGLDKLVKDGTLLNRLSGYRVDHYKKLGLQDKVFQMSAYLILTGAIRTNYVQYALPSNLRKYTPLVYWDNDRLLDWGKDLGPSLSESFRVFDDTYYQTMLNAANQGLHPLGPQMAAHLNGLKEREINKVIQSIQENFDAARDIPLLEMEDIFEGVESGDPDCPECKSSNGTIANSGLESLQYFRFKEAHGGRFFNLNNGLWVAEFNTPHGTLGQSPNTIPDGTPHSNGAYYYIYEPNQKGWVELDIPVTKGGDFLNIDEYIGPFLLEAGKGFVAIATPVEDFMIIITGKDLNGIDQSRLEAGIWLVVAAVPGAKAGKVLKPVFSAAKSSRVGKLIKIGNTYVVKLIEPISTAIKARIWNYIDNFSRTRLDEAIESGDFFKEVVEEAVEEIAEESSRKGRKLNWNELQALFKRGNDFNDKARAERWYPVRELNLIDKKRLDGYLPGREIVSRKATDLDKIQFSTFEKYVNEIAQKYPRGKRIRSNAYPELDGKTLQGDYILEIPASNQVLPDIQKYIDYARQKGVKIRFRQE